MEEERVEHQTRTRRTEVSRWKRKESSISAEPNRHIDKFLSLSLNIQPNEIRGEQMEEERVEHQH